MPVATSEPRGSQINIGRELRRRILTGCYVPGERLPPERELEEEFRCSRLTVAKAMAPLVADGLIERYRGRGTFVLPSSAIAKADGTVSAMRSHLSTRGNVIKYISPGQEPGTRGARDDVLAGLHQVLDEAGYHVSVDFYSNLDQHLKCMAKAIDPQIAGLVIWPVPDEKTDEAITRLAEHGVPLILIDTYLPSLNCDYVVTDNISGAAMMVKHLAELGHRRIAYLAPDERRTSLVDRMSGFLRGMVEAGLPIDDRSVSRLDPVADGGTVPPEQLARCVDSLLSQPNPPTAFFASHDMLAIAIQSLLRSRGVRVPEQIAVVGYDGIEAGEFCNVPLTTIKQDFFQTAQIAARILLERFGGRSNALRYHSLIRPKLLVRQSTAPAPRADSETST